MKTIKATMRKNYIHFTEIKRTAKGDAVQVKDKVEFTGERLNEKSAQNFLLKLGKMALIDNLETIEQTFEMPAEQFFELATPIVAGEPVETAPVQATPVREVPASN